MTTAPIAGTNDPSVPPASMFDNVPGYEGTVASGGVAIGAVGMALMIVRPTCCGKGQLLVFINLKVQWTNNKEDFVVEQSSGLRVENLSKVSGREMFKDSQYMVYPVMDFPYPGVAQASERLVREHQSKLSQTARILQQGHTIELIPVTRVTYSWKEKTHIYFVFGNKMSVNTDDYPATCSVM